MPLSILKIKKRFALYLLL